MNDKIVLPGDVLPKDKQAGDGTARVGDQIVATTTGLMFERGDKVDVVPLHGHYMPRAGDLCVGVVQDANPGNWIIDIRAPWLAPLHVSEAPWRVDFGETTEYLKPGDAVLCKILFVDEQKKVQVTLKDRSLNRLDGGEIIEISPVKVPRVIGRKGSMLNLVKGYLECWFFVGQNGRIWINGDPDEVMVAKEAFQKICDEAHLPGLTDRMRAWLEAKRPGGVDATISMEEE